MTWSKSCTTEGLIHHELNHALGMLCEQEWQGHAYKKCLAVHQSKDVPSFFYEYLIEVAQTGWQQCFRADDIIHNHHFDRNPVLSQTQLTAVDCRGWGKEIPTLSLWQNHTSILHRLFKFLLQILYTLKNPLQSKYLLIFVSLCTCKRQCPYAKLSASAFMHALMLLHMHMGISMYN